MDVPEQEAKAFKSLLPNVVNGLDKEREPVETGEKGTDCNYHRDDEQVIVL